MDTDKLQKLINDLKEHVARKQARAAEKYFNTLDVLEWVEGQRSIGAQMILDEFLRRFRSLEGLRPEWAERLAPAGEFDFRPRIAPGRHVDSVAVVKQKKSA